MTLSFVCALSVECLNTVGTVSVNCPSGQYLILCTVWAHMYMSTICTLFVHADPDTVCTLTIHCLYAVCILSVHISRYTVCQLALHCPYTVRSFSVHWLYIVCTLSVYLILSPVFVQYCSAPSPYLHKV